MQRSSIRKFFVEAILIFSFAAAGVWLTGCGYTFRGSGSVLPEDVKNVYIPLAENNSSEAGLSNTVTEALRDTFERYGVLRVVEDESAADAILKTRITRVKRATDTVTSATDSALQLATTITLSSELRRVTGPLLYRNPNVSVSETFGTQSDVVVTTSADFAGGNLNAGDLDALNTREVTRGQEEEAIIELAEKAANRIYDEAVAPDF